MAVGREAWTTNDNAEMTTQEREKLRVWHLPGACCIISFPSSTTFQVLPVCIIALCIQKKQGHGFAASDCTNVDHQSKPKKPILSSIINRIIQYISGDACYILLEQTTEYLGVHICLTVAIIISAPDQEAAKKKSLLASSIAFFLQTIPRRKPFFPIMSLGPNMAITS